MFNTAFPYLVYFGVVTFLNSVIKSAIANHEFKDIWWEIIIFSLIAGGITYFLGDSHKDGLAIAWSGAFINWSYAWYQFKMKREHKAKIEQQQLDEARRKEKALTDMWKEVGIVDGTKEMEGKASITFLPKQKK